MIAAAAALAWDYDASQTNLSSLTRWYHNGLGRTSTKRV
jgi:hypothetical protein